jgi:hypothetical protein
MILEFKEFELPEGKNPFDKDVYPASGLYLINDGMQYMLIYNPETELPPAWLPVPIKTVEEHIAKNMKINAERDMSGWLFKEISKISEKLEDKDGQSTDSFQYYQPEKIYGETLLKAIAIVQNPELAKYFFPVESNN